MSIFNTPESSVYRSVFSKLVFIVHVLLSTVTFQLLDSHKDINVCPQTISPKCLESFYILWLNSHDCFECCQNYLRCNLFIFLWNTRTSYSYSRDSSSFMLFIFYYYDFAGQFLISNTTATRVWVLYTLQRKWVNYSRLYIIFFFYLSYSFVWPYNIY